MKSRVTFRHIQAMKASAQKIPMVTAYDYTTAQQADEAGIPLLLVGDSLGMVVLGYDSTIPVTIEQMLHHVKAVSRGTKYAMVVADLPFMSYQIDEAQALFNAGRLIQEGGAQSVKLEGGTKVAHIVRRIVDCGIPVMGHIGLTPQALHGLGGYRPQGLSTEEARQIVQDSLALEEAGAYAIVMELIPDRLSGLISQRLSIPTIGIGAGPQCDGQVQVAHDMLGLYADFVPKHAKQYAKLGDVIREAFHQFAKEVKEGSFPTMKESVAMDHAVLSQLECSEAP